jgi:hypothetical protein
MLDSIRAIGSRWGVWWVGACVVAMFVISQTESSCRETLARSESCTGLTRTVHDEADAITGAIFVAMLIGGFGLGRLQRLLDTRPCPQCGERVLIGRMECEACGFDFAATTPRAR